MKILYLTNFAPWQPKFGGALRGYNILRGLACSNQVAVGLVATAIPNARYFEANVETGYAVTRVLGPLAEPDGRADSVASGAKGVLLSYLRGADPEFRPSFERFVKEVQPDLIWYHGKDCVWRLGTVSRIPSIVDMDNVESARLSYVARNETLFRAPKILLRAKLAAIEERWLLRRVHRAVIANPEELRFLHNAKVSVLPNGFDFPDRIPSLPRTTTRLLFLGSLFYQPNYDGLLWFCHRIWPILRRLCPNVTLDVVGHYEQDPGGIGEMEGIRLHGWVEDTSPFFLESACMVVPLRIGSGTRLKILEAWSRGLPVVSTTVGAQGLGARSGETLLLADTDQGFAQACVQLFNNPGLGVRFARNGFEHGKRNYDWKTLYLEMSRLASAAGSAMSGIQ